MLKKKKQFVRPLIRVILVSSENSLTVEWEGVSQKLNTLTERYRGPQASRDRLGLGIWREDFHHFTPASRPRYFLSIEFYFFFCSLNGYELYHNFFPR